MISRYVIIAAGEIRVNKILNQRFLMRPYFFAINGKTIEMVNHDRIQRIILIVLFEPITY
jgi:hypothetical protein